MVGGTQPEGVTMGAPGMNAVAVGTKGCDVDDIRRLTADICAIAGGDGAVAVGCTVLEVIAEG
jgi:hypothetical protein